MTAGARCAGPVKAARSISPHMTRADVRAAIAEIDAGDAEVQRARSAQLAWRPAWAIRSRRGALQALRAWIGRKPR